MLDKQVNKSNKFCICQECVLGSSYEEAYNNKFANTQELVHHYLKNCIYFKQKYNKSEQAEILAKSDKVVLATNNSFQESIDDNSATGSEVSLGTSSLQSKFQHKKNKIDCYLLWPLSEDQQKYFKQLLLKATVSCGWSFSWGNILIWSAKNISNECTRWPNIQYRTENMLDDLKKKQIKVIAVVTDCASEYEAARSCAALKNLATRIEEDNDNIFKGFLRTLSNKLQHNKSNLTEPLLFLSFLLHPTYHNTQFNQNLDDLSLVYMGKWIVHYYKSWFGKPSHSILDKLQHYESEEYPFNKETFNQFGGNLLKYWNFCKRVAEELHLVAVCIFSVCITTALVE
ncbi:23371_t:CDS:2 [Cetraspora pellucida]|uniref:23371_t:CDS:1 n=1 Tax=Cetraspora pellucida TaxID=1433469 RepID=A0A9N9I4Z6_9GLOM|nr:23371_t:CDS:2 [Cetraspora pellucida]